MDLTRRLIALERRLLPTPTPPSPDVPIEHLDEVLDAVRERIRDAHREGEPHRVAHLVPVFIEHGMAERLW